jgi:hypothetical protein
VQDMVKCKKNNFQFGHALQAAIHKTRKKAKDVSEHAILKIK